MQFGTLIEGRSCWVAGAHEIGFASKYGTRVLASREMSCRIYSRNIIAMPSVAGLDWAWLSSAGWEKSWIIELMCAPPQERALPSPLRYRGRARTPISLN